MRKLFEIGGLVAAAALIAFGVDALIMSVLGGALRTAVSNPAAGTPAGNAATPAIPSV